MISPMFTGKLSNFLVQANQAARSAELQWKQRLADGYVEIAPGVLRHPETGTEIHCG